MTRGKKVYLLSKLFPVPYFPLAIVGHGGKSSDHIHNVTMRFVTKLLSVPNWSLIFRCRPVNYSKLWPLNDEKNEHSGRGLPSTKCQKFRGRRPRMRVPWIRQGLSRWALDVYTRYYRIAIVESRLHNREYHYAGGILFVYFSKQWYKYSIKIRQWIKYRNKLMMLITYNKMNVESATPWRSSNMRRQFVHTISVN